MCSAPSKHITSVEPSDGECYIFPTLQLRKLRPRASKWQFWLQSPCALLLHGSMQVVAEPLLPHPQHPFWFSGLFAARARWRWKNEAGNFSTCALLTLDQKLRGLKPNAHRDHVGDLNG